MINAIVDHVNTMGSKLYLSKNSVAHGLGDLMYNIACGGYKAKHTPTESAIRKSVTMFRGDVSQEVMDKYIKDITSCWKKHGINHEDYFIYELENKSDRERAEYVSDVDRLKFASILNGRAASRIFKYKYRTYTTFKPFFHRDCIQAKSMDQAFFEKHPKFIFKQQDASRGKGTQILNIADFTSLQDMAAKTEGWDNAICEELIDQDPRFSAFHPESINTLRVIAVKQADGNVIPWHGILRCGRGDSFIDNTAAGGVFAGIDCKKGIINTHGFDKRGHAFDAHPDTGTVFMGTEIPDWDVLCNMLKDMMNVIPEVRYIGWDLALSTRGWVMVEGNSFSQITGPQMTAGYPLKPELLSLIRK